MRWWVAVLLVSCLPADDRPEPGSILVSTAPSEATRNGFATTDGWTVTFDRVVTALGDIRLHGTEDDDDSCTDYFETHYDRLFDFTEVTSSKVGLVYGLGTCSLEYRVRAPSDDGLLDVGVTKEDVTTMRISGTDAHADDERVTLRVQGHAVKGGEEKRFDWSFRHSYEISNCPDAIVELAAADALDRVVSVRAEELFREAADDASPLSFERFAAADADTDGIVTLAELDGADGMQPLGALVYEELLARVTRLEGGGACETELR